MNEAEKRQVLLDQNILEPDGDNAHSAYHAHVVPPRILIGVFTALMVLTFVTVAATWVNLGPANIWLALGIAVVKAGLVAMYFMHLRWDSPFNGIILISAMFFVALFIGIAILDSREYAPNYNPPGTIQRPSIVGPVGR